MALGTGPLPALPPEEPDGWAGLRGQAAGLLDQMTALAVRYDQIALEIAAETCSPDLARRVTLLTASFREVRAEAAALRPELARLTYEDRLGLAADREALAAAREEGRAEERARRQVPRPRHARTGLRLVGGAGLAAVLAGLRIAGRHKLATAAALAAVSVPAVTAAHMHVLPEVTSVIAGGPAPARHHPDADPAIPASPAIPVIPASRGKGTGPGTLSRKTRRVTPGPSQMPAAAPPPPAPSPVPAATATAGPPSLTILDGGPVILQPQPDGSRAGDIWLQATGGPAAWTADACPALTAAAISGTAEPGTPYDLGLSVAAGSPAGACLVTVTPAGLPAQQITVSWGGP